MSLGSACRRYWHLDPEVVFLNHGSFGACPLPVLRAQRAFRRRMERQPIDFMVRDLEGLLDEARDDVSRLLGARPENLGFVGNATTAVNAVAWSLELQPGDEIIVTGHTYGACRNALARAAARSGAKLVSATLPVPVQNDHEVIETISSFITDRTVFALIDHITSPTALVLPVAALVEVFTARGVAVMVDGAHSPAHVDVALEALGAQWWTGNLHKWLCAPKGNAVLHAREDVRERTEPLVTSHAYNSERRGRSRFLQGFDWPGTWDPTAVLASRSALRFFEELVDGGLPALMARNRALCQQAAALLEREVGLRPVAPPSMRGSMCAFHLWPGPRPAHSRCSHVSPVQDLLRERGIEVPVHAVPGRADELLLRISCHAYNELSDYQRLADELRSLAEQGYIEVMASSTSADRQAPGL